MNFSEITWIHWITCSPGQLWAPSIDSIWDQKVSFCCSLENFVRLVVKLWCDAFLHYRKDKTLIVVSTTVCPWEWPISYSNLLYQMDHYFLDIQYNIILIGTWRVRLIFFKDNFTVKWYFLCLVFSFYLYYILYVLYAEATYRLLP